MAKKSVINQRKVKNCEGFLRVLWNEGFISGYSYSNENENMLKIFLKYKEDGRPVINSIKLITKPSRRVYYSLKQLWKINLNSGLIIMSTNKGIMSIEECKKLKVGGEAFIIVT